MPYSPYVFTFHADLTDECVCKCNHCADFNVPVFCEQTTLDISAAERCCEDYDAVNCAN